MRRFRYEFFENEEHFATKLQSKVDSLEKYAKTYKGRRRKYNEQMRNIQQQKYETNEMKEIVIREQRQMIEEKVKQFMKLFCETGEKIQKVQQSFSQYVSEVWCQVSQMQNNFREQQRSLNPRSIQRFHLFPADGTLVGQQCAICLEDISVGRIMGRLTCDGQHAFCQICCETWFANNNTCPLCRHVFV